MRDDGFCYEESDDERTFGDELIPDCEREYFQDEAVPDFTILEYVAEFHSVIDACGQVSYYMRMKRNVAENVAKAKIVAAAYQHDLRYYTDQYNEWHAKAEGAFGALSFQAEKLGFEMPLRKNLLNALTLYKDRRKCYKYYLDSRLEKNVAFSPRQLEQEYQKMVRKRLRQN